jgi:hypothetical protein
MSTPIKTCFVFALISLAACGEGGDGPVPGPGPGPDVAGGPAPRPVVPAGPAILIVKNRYSNLTVTGVFLSPSYEDKWGTNQLQGKLLPPGQDLTLRQIPCADYYDLKITGSAGSTIGVVKELYFACGLEKIVTLSR